jgi:hypothetical protein
MSLCTANVSCVAYHTPLPTAAKLRTNPTGLFHDVLVVTVPLRYQRASHGLKQFCPTILQSLPKLLSSIRLGSSRQGIVEPFEDPLVILSQVLYNRVSHTPLSVLPLDLGAPLVTAAFAAGKASAVGSSIAQMLPSSKVVPHRLVEIVDAAYR